MTIKCPKCGASYEATAEYSGKSFQCPCGNVITVPVFNKAPTNNPVRPAAAQPARPAQPAARPAQPGARPMQQQARPAQQQARPGQQPVRPGQARPAQGAKPGQPGKPGQPTKPGKDAKKPEKKEKPVKVKIVKPGRPWGVEILAYLLAARICSLLAWVCLVFFVVGLLLSIVAGVLSLAGSMSESLDFLSFNTCVIALVSTLVAFAFLSGVSAICRIAFINVRRPDEQQQQSHPQPNPQPQQHPQPQAQPRPQQQQHVQPRPQPPKQG